MMVGATTVKMVTELSCLWRVWNGPGAVNVVKRVTMAMWEAKVCREGEKFGCSICFHHDDGAEEDCHCSDDHVLNRNLLPKKLCKCDIRKGA